MSVNRFPLYMEGGFVVLNVEIKGTAYSKANAPAGQPN